MSVGDKILKPLRVKEINYFDGTPIVSSLETILNKGILDWSSLKPGKPLKVNVKGVVGENYLEVEINDFITGRIY